LRAGVIDPDLMVIPNILKRLPARALLIAATATVIGVALTAVAVRTLAPPQLSFAKVLMIKALYGALQAAVIGPVVLRLALADHEVRVQSRR